MHICKYAYSKYFPAFLLLLCFYGSTRASATRGCLPNSTNISSNFSDSIASNAIVMLENGSYCMETFVPVMNLPTFSLIGVSGDVVINCAEGVALAFINITESFEMLGVTISGCGLGGSDLKNLLGEVNLTLNYYYNPAPGVRISVLMAAVHNATVRNVRVTDNEGFGLLAISLYGASTFSETEFTNNVAPNRLDSVLPSGNDFGLFMAGGAIFQFHDWSSETQLMEPVSLTISDCSFSNNTNFYAIESSSTYLQSSPTLQGLGYIISGAAGITIKLNQQNYTVNVTVRDSTISHNRAVLGGGAIITSVQYARDSTITFRNCDFSNNVNSSSSSLGMALLLSLNLWYWDFYIQDSSSVDIRFEQCKFVGNKANTGGAVVSTSAPGGLMRPTQDVVFRDCLFHLNQASSGAAVTIYTFENSEMNAPFLFVFDRCVFSEQTVTAQSTLSASFSGSGAIQLRSSNILLRDTTIEDTIGSGIQSLDSSISIEGKVLIANNSAFNGGAAQLTGFSFFVVRNGSHLTFRQNTAFGFGGAIYFTLPQNFLIGGSDFDCFLYPNIFDPFCFGSGDCNLNHLDFIVEFQNNSADLGSMIHGALLDTCVWAFNLTSPLGAGGLDKNHTVEQLRDNYSDNFIFDQAFQPSGINTNALSANIRVSKDNSTAVSAMPGEQISIAGTALDQLGSDVGDVLIAHISSPHFNDSVPVADARVGPNGLWRLDGRSTSNLRVDGPVGFAVEVTLTSSMSHAGSTLMVNLTGCRPGFVYNLGNRRCECDGNLARYGSTNFICNDTDSSFLVRRGFWFGQLNGKDSLQNDESPFVIAMCGSTDCRNPLFDPTVATSQLQNFDFMRVYPEQLDDQCTQNRHGLFCGKCKPDYSVKLTSLKCADCSGTGAVVLVLLFAILGVVLMAILTISDFHISSGYINGLIFYSNMIDLFYFQLTRRVIHSEIFILFEWLSLRWGIPTCFVHGLDRLTQTGLEFLFPLYLMFLLMVIALVSRYCHIPQKYRNAVNLPKMFATTLTLTFASILGTSTQILGFIVVHTSDPQVITVHWRRDPNVRYFQEPGHIILGLISIFAVLYLLTCTLMVMIPERLFCSSWCRKKIRSFKPITDCFQAPFRDNYLCRTWEGWRFLFRILIILVGFAPRVINTWVLIGILLVLLYFQTALRPFKGQIRNWLDSFFLLIFVVTVQFNIALDFFEVASTDVEYLVPFYILQSIVWVVITGIFIKCFVRCLRKLWDRIKVCCRKGKARKGMFNINSASTLTDSTILSESIKIHEEPRETFVDVEDVHVFLPKFGQLREGLLSYDSDEEEKPK